ncbi:MAG: hypothetical protein V3571_14795 [Pseudodesulfovibrio sp.]
MNAVAVLEIRAGQTVAAAYDFLEDLTREGLARLEQAMPDALRVVATDPAFAARLGGANGRVVAVPSSYWDAGMPFARVLGHAPLRDALASAGPDHVVIVPGASADRPPEELASARSLLLERDADLVMGAVELRDNPCQMKVFFQVEDINLLHPVERDARPGGTPAAGAGQLLTAPYNASGCPGQAGHDRKGARVLREADGRERLVIDPASIPDVAGSILAVAVAADGRPSAWVTASEAGSLLTLRPSGRTAARREVRLFPAGGRMERVGGTGETFRLPPGFGLEAAVPYVSLAQSNEMESDFWELAVLSEAVAGVDSFSGRVVNLRTNEVIRGRQDYPEILTSRDSLCAFRWSETDRLQSVLEEGRALRLAQSGVNAFYGYLQSVQRAGSRPLDLPRAKVWPADALEPESEADRSPLGRIARLGTVCANAVGHLRGNSLSFLGKRLAAALQEAHALQLELEKETGEVGSGLLDYAGSFGHESLGKPVSVMLAPDGSVLVADQADHEIQVFSPEFVPAHRLDLGLHCPEHFFTAEDGSAWLCDWRNGRLVEVGTHGGTAREIVLADFLPKGEEHRYPVSACARGGMLFVVATSDAPGDKRILGIRPGRSADTVLCDSSSLFTPKALALVDGEVVAGDFDFPALYRLDAGTARFEALPRQVPGLVRSLAQRGGLLFVSSPGHVFVYNGEGVRVETLDVARLTGRDGVSLRDLWVDEGARTLFVTDKGQRCIHVFTIRHERIQ